MTGIENVGGPCPINRLFPLGLPYEKGRGFYSSNKVKHNAVIEWQFLKSQRGVVCVSKVNIAVGEYINTIGGEKGGL